MMSREAFDKTQAGVNEAMNRARQAFDQPPGSTATGAPPMPAGSMPPAQHPDVAAVDTSEAADDATDQDRRVRAYLKAAAKIATDAAADGQPTG